MNSYKKLLCILITVAVLLTGVHQAIKADAASSEKEQSSGSTQATETVTDESDSSDSLEEIINWLSEKF